MSFSRQIAKNALLLILGASLYTLASPPYEWASAAWVALTPFFLVLRDKTPKAGFVTGLLFGILFCSGIAHWVYIAIATYFPFRFPLDLLFTALSYGFFVGTYTGCAATLSCVLMRRGSPLLCRIGIPALWVLGEFARSTLFSGFSWELLGYTQYRYLTLIQIADITGVYGVSFLLALSSYVAAEVIRSFRKSQYSAASSQHKEAQRQALISGFVKLPWAALGTLAVGVVFTLSYGTLRLREAPTAPPQEGVQLALVQGQVPHAQRWQRSYYARTLFHYATLTRRKLDGIQPDLIVWPEFALGFYLDHEPALHAQLSQFTQQVNAAVLFGAPRVEQSTTGERYYNSAYLLAPGGAVSDVYDKIRLLPFAEYSPFSLPALVDHSLEHPSQFTAGTQSTVFALPKGNFGVLICYEATYPHLARQLVQNGAQFLVNLSNDTWLAGEAAAAQHFSMVVFRAVETRRYLARVATAGITGFVDPHGHPYQMSSAVDEVVRGTLVPRHELTVYTRYGDWFVFVCAGWVVIAALLSSRVGRASDAHVSFTLSEQPATVLPVVVTSPVQYKREEHTPQSDDTL